VKLKIIRRKEDYCPSYLSKEQAAEVFIRLGGGRELLTGLVVGRVQGTEGMDWNGVQQSAWALSPLQ